MLICHFIGVDNGVASRRYTELRGFLPPQTNLTLQRQSTFPLVCSDVVKMYQSEIGIINTG